MPASSRAGAGRGCAPSPVGFALPWGAHQLGQPEVVIEAGLWVVDFIGRRLHLDGRQEYWWRRLAQENLDRLR